MINPKPTRRIMIDVGRKCNMNCLMCYYSHLGDLRLQKWANYNDLIKIIDQGKSIGCDYIEATGGEPTLYPEITNLVKYALTHGMKMCVITNATTGSDKALALKYSGIDDFLISWHGSEKVHDLICQMPGARKKQYEFINTLKTNNMSFRFNCVMSKFNESEIMHIAQEMAYHKPRIVNFIHINPHHGCWADKEKTLNILPDINVIEPKLNKAIEYLESKGIGVNVRYYPMCRISEKYRRCICNVLHVSYDPYEWNYARSLNAEANRKWSIENSKNQEEKGEPCCRCTLLDICGGINKKVNLYTAGIIPKPILTESPGEDFYRFRGHNKMTLEQII